ncbi:MAG TPA: GMC family oxidoreductase [Bryobacteraceae bacterium]|jgi:choline dehydrogenase-like flavoprotein|nr:GMC family oxidoreductase [Bryobacteraceae bacterium]
MQSYDAIIVGSGACGGWACMQLAQAGFKVALLEAGSQIDPNKEFRHRWPYELPFRGAGQPGFLRKYFVGATEFNYRIMIDDRENPYTTPPDKPFRWLRSRILGGRTLHWSRASDRMSDLEFKAASRDGYGENWPISYAGIAPYYDRVESFIGVSAAPAGLPQFPDGVFLPPMPLNCAETIFQSACGKLRLPCTPRRVAQLTRMWHNRPPCHYCGNCVNGCDVGAMFNSIAVTLPPALKTGNVTLLCDSVASHVLTDDENRARGIRYIERFTQRPVEIRAHIVILAGSSLENTRLLLNSRQGGLANSSGVLGQYLMDQVGGAAVTGFLPPLKGTPIRNDDGKLGGLYIPNFSNLGARAASGKFIRGYSMSASGGAAEFPMFAPNLPGFGSTYKKEVKRLYPSYARVWMSGGEMLARKENFVELDPQVRDQWGIPVLKIHCALSDNDRSIYQDFVDHALELFRAAGGETFGASPQISIPGSLIHEVGTSRMGSHPKSSVLNSFCQTHDIPNLFVFGGGCFVSTGDKHPTLTMMALTARGCDYLIDRARKGELA